MKKKFWIILLICTSAAVLTILPLFLSEYYTGLLTRAVILAILAMSVNLLLGHLGLASVGHSVFFGIASYAVGIVTMRLGTSFWPSAGLAISGAMIASGLFGFLAIRTKDIFFLTIMLAFCQVFYGLSVSWKTLTGGYDGLPGLLRPQVIPGLNLELTTHFYFLVVICFLVVMGGYWILTNSPFGLTLKGIRDSESRMKVLGYNVWLYKYLAFNISALIGSLAGILHAYYDGCPNPADFGIVRSSTALFMVILGGPGTLAGPLVGSVIIVFLQDLISNFTDRWIMVLGAVYAAVVLLFPEGILGGIKKRIEASVGLKRKKPV